MGKYRILTSKSKTIKITPTTKDNMKKTFIAIFMLLLSSMAHAGDCDMLSEKTLNHVMKTFTNRVIYLAVELKKETSDNGESNFNGASEILKDINTLTKMILLTEKCYPEVEVKQISINDFILK